MDNTYLTKQDLEKLFWRITMIGLGYNPDSYINHNKNKEMKMPVRDSWPKEGAPAWDVTEDVCFFRVNFQPQPIGKQIEDLYLPKDNDYTTRKSGQTRVLNISWIFYGPNSYDHAFQFRFKLFEPECREPLSKLKIYVVPDVDEPVRSPEPYQGQYWERADLSARFNESVKFQTDIPYLKSADIQIINDRGDVKNVHVES